MGLFDSILSVAGKNAGASGSGTGSLIGSIAGSFIPGLGTIAGGLLGGIADSFGPSKENADKSNYLFNQYVSDQQNRLPYYPSKKELLAAATEGGWEQHIKESIASSYNQSSGTWDRAGDDFKGAVYSFNPIRAYAFKGHTEQYSLVSNTPSKLPTSSGLNSMFTTSNTTTGFNGTQQPTTSRNYLWWIILGIVGTLTVLIFIFKRKH